MGTPQASSADAPERARRLNIGGMPPAPTGLLLTASGAVALVEVLSFVTIAVLRDALLQAGIAGWAVWVALAILALASAAILLPLSQTFLGWRDVRRAIARHDVVAARVMRSEARERGWI